MIRITIRNDEVTVRSIATEDDDLLEAANRAAREIAAIHGWIVDSKTRLFEYRERVSKIHATETGA